MSTARPLGYFLWGLIWLLIAVMVLALPPFVLWAAFTGRLTAGGDGDGGSMVLVWIIGVPLCAWLFVIFPFVMLSQALMGFVASGLALRPENRDTQVVAFVGTRRYRMMEP